ncbi:MAG: hypothetical protein ABI666_02680 [Ferruginibacter sp.]
MNAKFYYTMKQLMCFLFIVPVLTACNQSTTDNRALQNRIDSLENKLANAYKPGFGEFMSGIQSHHAKLWFAGQNQNWKLCDFEIHEIIEAIDNVEKYEPERPESKMIGMIRPALDSVNNAIQQKNLTLFKSNYVLLTNTCNNCHHAAQFEFNVVKIPEVQIFSNQDFKSHE